MRFWNHVPARPLSDFVALLWIYEGYQQPHKKERLLPDGSVEIVFNLKEDRTRVYDPIDPNRCHTHSGALIAGPHSEFFVIDTAEQLSVAGIHFRPGGALPFLGLPAGELHNRHVSLEDLWGAHAREVRDRLLAASSPDESFRILEQALLTRAARGFDRHPAVAYALREFFGRPQARTIAGVTAEIGLSAKRFIDVFHAEVGLTPKLFCRIQRFQRALRRVHGGRPVDWVTVAADCGYFDQAHFIRDFRAFSGINPTTYLAQCTPHLNHVPIRD